MQSGMVISHQVRMQSKTSRQTCRTGSNNFSPYSYNFTNQCIRQPFRPVTRAADDPRLPVFEVRPMQECMPTVQPLPAWHDEVSSTDNCTKAHLHFFKLHSSRCIRSQIPFFKIELWPLPKYSAFDLSLGPDGIFVADRMNFLSPLSNELDAKSHINGECNSLPDGTVSFPSTSFSESAIKIGRFSCVR